ncbi:biotin--[acetyl-CoA-carboxylase] ligase [Marinisporobacter balticus]|uniref:Bifunctional ligase/repressor BirA n=1 Tax=Marinisporobacter balticus TaxID=2018667 RepID=A0A4R2KL02_9FIRM|nr:biotin--[acetyl-CoA-carboxylase] ligase [Marinisporobacter balticus]TCO71336.1 BirA family biotin operon repressor/biotin-[acetyl-CoA-carboxylase] ligase [Marinisporobacter balticus]
MKKDVLEALKNNKDVFISGEELSKKIGVTRTAVWKNIKQLKEEGYEIESVSRKGYRLTTEPDTLDANVLEIEVASKHIGNKIYHFESIDSTNTIAKKLATEGAIEGTIIIAEEQSGARGRLGRNWVSPNGTGIWMSMILRPNIEPMEATKITQITAAAVALAIKKVTGCDVGIKWPNDIIINKKKVCGILTEMSAELNCVNYIIVGIGINVNMNLLDFPEEIRPIATSIKSCVGESVSRKKIVTEILHKFEELYLDFVVHKNIEKSMNICKKYSVTLGNQVKIKNRNKEIIAQAIDLTEDGQLLIKNELGEIEKVLSGEVSVRGLTDYV